MFSLEMISDNLPQYSRQLHSHRKQERSFKDVRLFTAQRDSSYTPETAYFINVYQDNPFPLNPAFDYILVGDSDPCIANTTYLFIEATDEETGIVFEAIRDVLDRYLKDFYWKLQECALKNGDLSELLNVAYPFFQNPMYIADSAFVLLAYTKDASIANPTPQWTSITQKGILGADIVAEIKTSSISDLDKLRKASFMHPVDSKEIRNIVAHIEKNGMRIANIAIIESERPLKQYHLALTDYLISCISCIIDNAYNNRKLAGALYEKWLKMLFDGEVSSPEIIESHLKNIGWKIEDTYQVGVIDFLDKPKTGIESLEYYWRLIALIMIDHKSFIYKGSIVILFHYHPKEFSEKLRSGAFEKVIAEGTLRCGISRPFSNIANTSIHYGQALRARKYATEKSPSVTYSDIMIEDLLDNPAFSELWKANIEPSIAKIFKDDISNNTHDIDLLYHYLLFDRSLMKCSKELNVHRNTVIYRIKKICNNFELDLDNPSTKMNILASCRIALINKTRSLKNLT